MKTSDRSCRAAALVGPGQPLEIIDVQIPDQLEPGSVLVKTVSATVCGTDVHLADGAVSSEDAGARFPVILGHEMVGVVERMGGAVTTDSVGQPLRTGDRVIWTHGFCGQCLECVVEHRPALCSNRRGYMETPCTEYPYLTGGFSEYGYIFPTAGRVKVPDDVPDEAAAAAACALRTVIQGFDRLGPLDDRQTVVIQGSGPLGLFALAKAVTAGPAQVIVIGGPPSRLELATNWGADVVIDIANSDRATRRETVLALTGGRGADVVVEMSGVPSAFNEGVDLLRAGGRYLVIGQIHDKTVDFNPSAIVMKDARLIGSLSASVEHYYRALEFMSHHKSTFNWNDMITRRYPLEDINQAFTAMRTWEVIKPAITFA